MPASAPEGNGGGHASFSGDGSGGFGDAGGATTVDSNSLLAEQVAAQLSATTDQNVILTLANALAAQLQQTVGAAGWAAVLLMGCGHAGG